MNACAAFMVKNMHDFTTLNEKKNEDARMRSYIFYNAHIKMLHFFSYLHVLWSEIFHVTFFSSVLLTGSPRDLRYGEEHRTAQEGHSG